MKKIINGKRYDTDTAIQVGEWENMIDVLDMHHFTETLYRKRTGEYFIYGVGNAGSKYSRSTGNNTWCGGSAIIPLTYDAAREWAEDHMDADEYEAEFGEVSEDGDGDVVISIRVSPAAKAALDKAAAQTGRTKSDILTELLTGM
jgi:predicted transcriptional regulator